MLEALPQAVKNFAAGRLGVARAARRRPKGRGDEKK